MRRSAVVPLVLLMVGTLSARPIAKPPHGITAPQYRITDLRAQLFYSDRGTFSQDILAAPKPTLWNTVIGAGDAGGASTATLVTVEVSGPPDSYESKREVEIAVSTHGRELLRRRLPLSVMGEAGHTYVGLWLEKTGCEPLRISTALLGQADPSRKVDTIPFECGE